MSTEAKGDSYLEKRVETFARLGGPEVGELAHRRFFVNKGQRDEAAVAEWRKRAMPFYTRKSRDESIARAIIRQDVLQWFTRPDGGEGHRFDMMADLGRIACPTLVIGGEDDPMTPIDAQIDIANALPKHLTRFERFAECGHGIVADAPEAYLKMIREFVACGELEPRSIAAKAGTRAQRTWMPAFAGHELDESG